MQIKDSFSSANKNEVRMRKCCPDCGSTQMTRRITTHDYKCFKCGHICTQPATKMAKCAFNFPLEASA